MRLFKKEVVITRHTPPAVARAQINEWQREDELTLALDVLHAVKKAVAAGIERDRIVKMVKELSTNISRTGEST